MNISPKQFNKYETCLIRSAKFSKRSRTWKFHSNPQYRANLFLSFWSLRFSFFLDFSICRPFFSVIFTIKSLWGAGGPAGNIRIEPILSGLVFQPIRIFDGTYKLCLDDEILTDFYRIICHIRQSNFIWFTHQLLLTSYYILVLFNYFVSFLLNKRPRITLAKFVKLLYTTRSKKAIHYHI